MVLLKLGKTALELVNGIFCLTKLAQESKIHQMADVL